MIFTAQGPVKKREHIEFKTKNDKLRTRSYLPSISQADIDSDTSGITHEVMKLTMRSGEEFVVDLACAQYGYAEPVMRWKEYKELRILFEYPGSGLPLRKSFGTLQVDDYSIDRMVFFWNKMGEKKPDGFRRQWIFWKQ